MFQEMANRSEQLFFSSVGAVEDNLFQLPAFLEALAAIVKEMGEVDRLCTNALICEMINYFRDILNFWSMPKSIKLELLLF